MGHSNPAAKIQSGKVSDAFSSNELKIAELRKQRAAKMAVNRYDFIDALLEEYDIQSVQVDGGLHFKALYETEQAAVLHLGASTAALLKRAEEAEAVAVEAIAALNDLKSQAETLKATANTLSNQVQAELVQESQDDKELSEAIEIRDQSQSA